MTGYHLRVQQKELQEKRDELLNKMNDKTNHALNLEMVKEYVSSLKTLLSGSSFIEQKSFLRSFIKRVELNVPQIVINYTVPLPVKGLTTTEEVLRIDKLGSPRRIRTYNLVVNSHDKKVRRSPRLKSRRQTMKQ